VEARSSEAKVEVKAIMSVFKVRIKVGIKVQTTLKEMTVEIEAEATIENVAIKNKAAQKEVEMTEMIEKEVIETTEEAIVTEEMINVKAANKEVEKELIEKVIEEEIDVDLMTSHKMKKIQRFTFANFQAKPLKKILKICSVDLETSTKL